MAAAAQVLDSYDVVVIGAGIGGLTAAALLAKSGLRVCVLERAEYPGGYLAGFRRVSPSGGAFQFDTAIHWLNQCGPGGAVRRVLSIVGPGAPETPPLARIRRYRSDHDEHLLTDEPDVLRDRLVREHPEDTGGIHRYFESARTLGGVLEQFADHMRVGDTMTLGEKMRHGTGMAMLGARHVLPHLRWSTEDAFERLFHAPSLARLHCSERRLVSCLFPLAWAYTRDYQSAPRGGSRALTRFLTRAIRAWGGSIVCSATVDEIHVERRRVEGVSFSLDRIGARRRIHAPHVLAACDPGDVYERMLPPGSVSTRWLDKLRRADVSDSHVTVFLGLDRPAEELGFDDVLTLLTRDDVSRNDHHDGDPERSAITVLASSVRDPSLAPPGKGSVRLTVSAPWAHADVWRTGEGATPGERIRGPEYHAYKNAYADVLVDRVARALSPDLARHVELREVATPITHHRYTGNRGGSIVGTTPTPSNIWNGVAHYRTPIGGLFVSGQWAELGGGVPIAVKAGTNAALLVLRDVQPAAFTMLAEALDGARAPDELDPAILRSLPHGPPPTPARGAAGGTAAR